MIQMRLDELGIVLPQASAPAAKYANAVIVNGIMYVSGKGPDTTERGKLGEDFTTEQGMHARSVFGVVSVRDNLPLIIDSIFQVEE